MLGRIVAVAFAASVGMGAAQAATVIVTPGNPQGWSSPAGESTGGGSAAITATSAYDGNGSLEVHGDRTRFVLGNLYSPLSNLGALSNFTDLSFSYQIDAASVTTLANLYSPALRLTFWNGGVKDEFVFEQAYQTGGYGAAAPKGDWNTTSSSSLFYRKSNGNENDARTLASWLASTDYSNAYVSAVYVGVGSGAAPTYKAYADDIVANGTTYNFEASATGAVPEPASWALMLVGFGAMGGAMRMSRKGRSAIA